MSAICGYAGSGDAALLERMLRRMRHRGPDALAKETSAGLGLGLAYGKSPLGDAAGKVARAGDVACVIDGYLLNAEEIRARLRVDATRASDAELVAHLFAELGEDALSELDGAFALAIRSGRRLLFARDALGEKPLYYTRAGKTLLFASEIKAFLAHASFRVKPNLEALTRLLAFSFVPGEETMFGGVEEVLPGQVVEVASGRVTTRLYWDLYERPTREGENALARRVEAATVEAVARRLPKRASANIGVFLSGGLDSSSIVALLAQLGAKMTAFSVGFGEGFPNELLYARMVAQHCNVPHRVLEVHPEGFLEILPKIIYSLDDPLCDCITVPNYLLAKAAAAAGCDVVFNGEGGDPLFGGPKNKFLILGEWYAFLGGYDRARAYLSSYHKFFDHLGAACTPALLRQGGGEDALVELVRPFLGGKMSFLNRLMYVNVKLKGGQNILVKVDKMLSANSLTVASPLFDRRLAELSFEIPPRLKRRGDVEKYIYKKAVEHTLPHPVVYRKKAGMGVPLNQWFRQTALRGYATGLLLSKRARERGLFRTSFVEALLGDDAHAQFIGADRSGELLWMLVAIELWFRVYADGDGA